MVGVGRCYLSGEVNVYGGALDGEAKCGRYVRVVRFERVSKGCFGARDKGGVTSKDDRCCVFLFLTFVVGQATAGWIGRDYVFRFVEGVFAGYY